MILVTVGTMFPFDRMVRAMDRWAAAHTDEQVVAQIGTLGDYRPRHMRCSGLVPPTEFGELVAASRLIVSHAGTGSYMLAAEKARPIVMFPRRAAFKEHTSDHQLETARWLQAKKGVYVALTEHDLPNAISAALSEAHLVMEALPRHAPAALIAKLRDTLTDFAGKRRLA